MIDRIRSFVALPLLGTFAIFCLGLTTNAEEFLWTVTKSSGEVWVITSGAQPVSLGDKTSVRAGDSIKTGKSGRVLLVRGEETILVSPDSAIGIPVEKKDGLSTTILQQAGSILLNVEKRNENHFAVETPYLVAVVKGTEFRVTVGDRESNVEVLKGKVEVADFKSGQYAFVLSGQTAKVSAQGRGGLSLTGHGALSPVLQGKPRSPSVAPGSSASLTTTNDKQLRIAAPLGEVKLDVHKVTKGMARSEVASKSSGDKDQKEAGWNSKQLSPGNGASQSSSGGGGNGNGNGGGTSGNSGGNSGGDSGNGGSNGHNHACNGKGKGKGKGNSC